MQIEDKVMKINGSIDGEAKRRGESKKWMIDDE